MSLSESSLPVLGPITAGILLYEVLFGILISQVFVYFQSFPKDRVWIKYLVGGTGIVMASHALLMGAALFNISVNEFGSLEMITQSRFPLSFFVALHISIFIDMVVQAFFTVRLWKMSGQTWMPCVAGIFILGKAASGWLVTTQMTILKSLALFIEPWGWAVNTTLACATAGDVFTAVALTFVFYSKQDLGLHKKTEALLQTLIKWTVNTGIIIGVATLVVNILFLAMKGNLAWLGLHMLLPVVYTNSMLACLNSRRLLDTSHILPSHTGQAKPSTLTVMDFRSISSS
jgi:hypothetical protein